jgi:hypothetical protein
MPGGGLPREWLRPLRRDGHLNDPNDALGCHRGDFEHLNVVNAQPGFRYYYARNKSGSIARFLRQGWELVTSDHPEKMGHIHNPHYSDNPSGLQQYEELVLMRIPTEVAAQRRQERAAQVKAQLTGATKEFLEESDTDLQGRPIRYRRDEHVVRYGGHD